MKLSFAACALLALAMPALAPAAGQVTEAKLGKRVVDRRIAGDWTVTVTDSAGKTLYEGSFEVK